jgi:cell fate (sporulation/competence/biofilm development) regulator YlbF (YheA/YmcA/DUF963 family)
VTKFSPQEKAEAAEREVKQRQRVYAHRVAEGKMTLEFARLQTEIMQEIAEDYGRLAKADHLL